MNSMSCILMLMYYSTKAPKKYDMTKNITLEKGNNTVFLGKCSSSQ